MMRKDIDLFRNSLLNPLKNFQNFFEEYPTPSKASEWLYTPTCDLEETGSHFVASVDMPGVAKEDIKIESLGNKLTISAERKKEFEESKNEVYYSERYFGSLRRTIELPADIDTERIEAVYQNGVLKIAIPKSASVTPTKIKIGDGKAGFFSKLLGSREKEHSIKVA